MLLVKFTDPEWKQAAIKGTSIRIGSVLYYREIKDPTFQDENEGEGAIIYKSKNPLDSDIHNQIFKEEGYQLNEGWTIDTGGCPLISQKSKFNPFIYSCSLVRKESDMSKIARKFNKHARYYISDVWEFVNSVSLGLHDHIISSIKADSSIAKPEILQKLEQLEILPVIGKVRYTDDNKDKIINNFNAKSFNPRTFELKSYFRKPTLYADEHEFRMIWLTNLGNMEKNEFDFINTTIRTVDLSLSNHGLSSHPKSIKEILNKKGKLIT